MDKIGGAPVDAEERPLQNIRIRRTEVRAPERPVVPWGCPSEWRVQAGRLGVVCCAAPFVRPPRFGWGSGLGGAVRWRAERSGPAWCWGLSFCCSVLALCGAHVHLRCMAHVAAGCGALPRRGQHAGCQGSAGTVLYVCLSCCARALSLSSCAMPQHATVAARLAVNALRALCNKYTLPPVIATVAAQSVWLPVPPGSQHSDSDGLAHQVALSPVAKLLVSV